MRLSTACENLRLYSGAIGLRSLLTDHPDVEITVAGIDATLTDIGLVEPGLGDAGDRQFGTEVSAQTRA